jgi:hypothetical protein
MRMLLSIVLLSLVATACLGGCRRESASTGAKQDFARRYSCPEDRVTVRERKDVDPAVLLAPPATESPPAEVKSDPGRLAKWEADRKAKRAETEAGYRRSFTIFEASGCDHAALLACTYATLAGTEGATTLECREAPASH